jgi:F-type H+-transporting ATPase subunit delta
MSASSTARRYAAALFDVVRKYGSEERAGRELSDIARLFSSHAELNRLLGSPAIPAVHQAQHRREDPGCRRRRRLPGRAADDGHAGGTGWLAQLPEMAAAFSERLLDVQRVVRANVTTAVPLTDASRAALTGALAKATGKTVTITEKVDPAIVGGLVARVGSVVYDASVTRQLERIREKLTTSS